MSCWEACVPRYLVSATGYGSGPGWGLLLVWVASFLLVVARCGAALYPRIWGEQRAWTFFPQWVTPEAFTRPVGGQVCSCLGLGF